MENNLISTLVAMTGFALATSASPGPVNIVSAMSGARFGAGQTIPYILGATVGFVSILAITGSGLSPVIMHFPHVEHALALLGSLYMLYLAYSLARASMVDMDEYEKSSPPNIFAGILAQYTNPKAWIVAISAISIYVSTNENYNTALAIFCCIFFIICFPSLWVWSIIGASFSRKLGGIKIFNVVMSCLLAGSVVAFILDYFR